MLSITQNIDSRKIAIPEKVRAIGYDLMLFHKQAFPWAVIPQTVHQMCAHSWELFVLTEGKPIARYSEQEGKAWNKHIRSYKSGPAARARQTSIRVNTQDVFQRMMNSQPHPLVASKKHAVFCWWCNLTGHTVRSCDKDLASVLNAEATAIRVCYVYQ